jgi:hypothetical protein
MRRTWLSAGIAASCIAALALVPAAGGASATQAARVAAPVAHAAQATHIVLLDKQGEQVALRPDCNPCGPYYIALIGVPGSVVQEVFGDGHNNPVEVGFPGTSFDFIHDGSWDGNTVWEIQDISSGLCLNAAYDDDTGLYEQYEDSCNGDTAEQNALNVGFSGHFYGNVSVSKHYACTDFCAEWSASGVTGYVDVLYDPPDNGNTQWTLITVS